MKKSRKQEIWEWVESFLTLLIFTVVWIAIYLFMWTGDRHYPG
jgi:hypothetical protein